MDKNEMRKLARTVRDGMPPEEILRKSRHITNLVLESDFFKKAKDVLLYVSTGSEAATHELIKKSLLYGKSVFVPKVYGKEMEFIRIESFDELSGGYYGILEPVKDEPVWKSDTGLMIMPGLAFDRNFNRIGYGGGFYDKFLSRHNHIYKAALCFECQIYDSISAQDTDIRPDCIVTEKEILVYGQR